MVGVTIIGGGAPARDCGEVLSRAGVSLAHSFELEGANRSPIILGEVQNAFQVAQKAVESGRHILIAAAQVLTPERLDLLLENRRNSQAIFVWSDRRSQPGYRFIEGLMESDSSWKPRYMRNEFLCPEAATTNLFRWRALESMALINGIAMAEPRKVQAWAVMNARRQAADLVSLNIDYMDIDAYLTVGLGEPLDRRETLVASATRKAYIDELNPNMPIRIVDDEPATQNSARWLACTAASSEELARQQCIAFLDATLDSQRTQEDALVWLRSLATLAAMERSIATGTVVEVVAKPQEHGLRIIGNLQPTPPSIA